MSVKRENFYRRDPSKALSGMIGLTLEERGVYNTVIDLLYSTWRPLEDDRAFIAGWCGCAVQKLNPIVNRLIEKGRLITFTEGARTFLSDEAFEVERAAVKGPPKSRSGRGEVREKSAGVEEKSAGVETNPRLLDTETTENQSVTALEKTRVEKKGAKAPPSDGLFAKAWETFPEWGRRRSSRPKAATAWAKVVDEAGGEEALFAAVRRYAADPDTQREEGRFVPGFDRWLRDGKWEHHRADLFGGEIAETDALPERVQRSWAADWRDKGPNGWKRWERGPCPGEPGCRVSPSIIAEFTRERISA